MENNIKSKVFTVIYAIVLIAAFIGAVQLLYNAIDMMTYTTLGEYEYGKLQEPLAINSLVAGVVAFVGIVVCVISFCVKGKIAKTVCHVLIIAVSVVLLVLIIVSSNVWVHHYKEGNSNYDKPPYDVSASIGSSMPTLFTLYSAVMAMLVPQLIYFAVLAALHIWGMIKLLKNKRIAQTADKDGVATEEVK